MTEKTKVCNVCKEEKPYSEYHKHKQCKDGVHATCKPCNLARSRKWYEENKERVRPVQNEKTKQKSKDRKREWVEKMGDKCQDCGQQFPDVCYDFHRIGGKDANPSAALRWNRIRMEEELSKCVLLCANCHRLRHFDGGNNL